VIVTLDTPDVLAEEDAVFIERTLDGIADPTVNARRTSTATGTLTTPGYNVVFHPLHGWTLASQHETFEADFEQSTFGITDITLGSTIDSLFSKEVYRPNSDLPGVSTGLNQRTSGFTVLQKEIGAGGTFAEELAADASAYPGPPIGSIQPVKRIAVSAENLVPTDQIQVSVLSYGQSFNPGGDVLERIYFVGPAGNAAEDLNARGLGQYCLSLLGSGTAVLFERLYDAATTVYSWAERQRMNWTSMFGRQLVSITIRSDSILRPGGVWEGTKLFFRFVGGAAGSPTTLNVETLIGIAIGAVDRNHGVHVYDVPNAGVYQPVPEKFRLDERVDVRSQLRLTQARYYRNGSIRGKTISLSSQVSGGPASEPIYVQWFGDKPDGTNIVLRLFDAETGNELTALGLEQHWVDYGYKGFDAGSGRVADTSTKKYNRKSYYAVVEFTSTDGSATPLLRRLRITRNARIVTNGGTNVVAKTVQGITLTGGDSDPTHETALLQITDLGGDLDLLSTRASMPIRIDVRYDPEDETKLTTLLSGYVQQARKKIAGPSDGKRNGANELISQFPVLKWSTYDVRCSGEWQRLMEAKTKQAYSFSQDASVAGQARPWKITDIVRTLLRDAGYNDQNIIVPDLPLRLFANKDANITNFVEPQTEILPLLLQLVNIYLGGWLCWDDNASLLTLPPTKMGAWRVKLPVRPTEGQFPTLVHFRHAPTRRAGTLPDGALGLERYSVDTQRVDMGINDQPILNMWVRKNSVREWVAPPEANKIRITGSGETAETSQFGRVPGNRVKTNLTQILYNFKSAKFFAEQPIEPDPNSPDYLGRPVELYIGDPSFNTPEIVNFVARRVYDMVAHGQYWVSFEAPLVLVTDVSDTYQRRPRRLMFGDSVKYEGRDYIVANCNPDITGGGSSRRMMATYELFSPAQLNSQSWTPYGADL
jgi:hypothetical protein